MQISRIPLKNINFADFSFSLLPEGYGHEIAGELKESIIRAGILHPPIVREDKQNFSYRIIAGRKRLNAACSLGFSFCDCLKVPSDYSDRETLNIVWEEAIHSHSLSSLEQAIFFDKAGRFCSIAEIAGRFLPLLGLPPSTDYVDKKLRLLQLDEPLQIAVHEGKLNEQVSLDLGELPFSDRMALFEVMGLLKLSVSNQKKLTRSCRELAGRKHTSVLSILSQPELSGIINDSDNNIPQKASRYMKKINEERFPRLKEAENDFRRFTAGLSLPENITISHDPSFEKDELNLTISCSDRDMLKKIVGKIT